MFLLGSEIFFCFVLFSKKEQHLLYMYENDTHSIRPFFTTQSFCSFPTQNCLMFLRCHCYFTTISSELYVACYADLLYHIEINSIALYTILVSLTGASILNGTECSTDLFSRDVRIYISRSRKRDFFVMR